MIELGDVEIDVRLVVESLKPLLVNPRVCSSVQTVYIVSCLFPTRCLTPRGLGLVYASGSESIRPGQ